MKNLLYGIIAVLSVFCFTACEKEYSLEIGNNLVTGPGSFRANVDGEQWIATLVKSASRLNGVILLAGSAGDGTSITMRVKDSGTHVYRFHNTSTDNLASYMDSSIVPIAPFRTDQWLVDSLYGELAITNIDTVRKLMSGNFNFKAYRSVDGKIITITNGQFNNISYGVPALPPTADTFRVKIDGVDFNYNSLNIQEDFGLINITAMNGSGQMVTLLMSSGITPGGYSFGAMTPTVNYFPDFTTQYETLSGLLNIEQNNTSTGRIRGTFNFEANDPDTPLPANIQFTDGFFSLSY